MDENDRRDLAITAALDALACKIMRANKFSRQEVLSRFAAFAENDEEAPVTPVAPIDLKPPRKRARKAMEAHP